MEFTKDWTKEDNKILRDLIKEGKTPFQIVDIIGYDKLRKSPNKKYVGKFSEFILNEIYAKPKETVYKLHQEVSKCFPDNIDYIIKFKTNSEQEYILSIVYVEDKISPFPGESMFNISFTIKEHYDIMNYLKYEKETNRGEIIEITKRLIYIMNDMDILIKNRVTTPIYIIGETDNPQKINFYRNIIKNSIIDFEEIKGKSSINLGKGSYYYYEKLKDINDI